MRARVHVCVFRFFKNRTIVSLFIWECVGGVAFCRVSFQLHEGLKEERDIDVFVKSQRKYSICTFLP